MKRRDFIKLLGATTGTALVASCGVQKGTEKLIPHVIPPEDGLAPGQPYFYNSTCTECPANCGLTVKVHEKLTTNNRYERYPVKLEGLSGHPINDGTLCIRGQSSLTRLYHPERLKEPLIRSPADDLTIFLALRKQQGNVCFSPKRTFRSWKFGEFHGFLRWSVIEGKTN